MGYVKEKYTKEYFLGSVDQETGKEYGAAGNPSWKKGEIDIRFILPFEHTEFTNSTVLDIGCGRGECLAVALERGSHHATGVDFSAAALSLSDHFLKARNIPQNRYTLMEIDAKDLKIITTFDYIFMIDAIEHIPTSEVDLVMNNIYNIMHDSSQLFVATHVFEDENELDESDHIPSTSGMHCNKYTEDKLLNLFAKHKLQVIDNKSDSIEFRYWLKK